MANSGFQKKVLNKQREFKEKSEKDLLRYRHAFNAVFSTEEGQVLLRWLLDQTGYQKPKTLLNRETMEINALATVHDAALEELYINLRKYIKPEILYNVEILYDSLDNLI